MKFHISQPPCIEADPSAASLQNSLILILRTFSRIEPDLSAEFINAYSANFSRIEPNPSAASLQNSSMLILRTFSRIEPDLLQFLCKGSHRLPDPLKASV